MSVSFLSIGSAEDASAGTTITLASFAPPAGTDRVLLVWSSAGALSPGPVTGGITWNGVALTHVTGSNVTRGFGATDLWYLLEADFPGSASNIVCTTATYDEKSLVAAVYGGVDQTTPFRGGTPGQTANGNSTAPSLTLSSDAADLVVALQWGNNPNTISSPSGSQNLEDENVLGFWNVAQQDRSGASPTLSWTLGSTDDWMMSGVSMIAGAGATSNPHASISLLGVG